jgi:tetratricopeptide (TPR) repeat protein
MRKSVFLFFTLLFTWSASAQINIDSLKTALADSPTDTATLNKQITFLETLSADNMEAVLILANWISEHALAKKEHKIYATAQLAIATLYHHMDNYGPAMQYYVAVQNYTEKHGLEELNLHALNNLANIYYLNNQYAKAEELYWKIIEGCKKLDIKRGLITSYGSLGTIYFANSKGDINEKKKGIRFMFMSSDISISINDTMQLIRSYSGIGKMYSELDMPDSAIYWINRSYDLMSATTQHTDGYVFHYYHKGMVLSADKKYQAAIESFLTGVDYTKKYKAKLWESSHYDGLANAYKALGNYKKALEYAEMHFHIEDSVINAINFAKAADEQNKYERETKDRQLLVQSAQLKVASERRSKLITLFIASLVVLGLLGVFSVVLMKNIRARKKAYAELQEKSIKIQEQAVELSKQARLIAKFQSQMNPHFVFNALHNIQGLVISNENKKATNQIQSLAQLMRKTFANAEKDDIPLEEEISYLQKYIDFERTAFDNKLEFDITTGKDVENVLIPPMMIQPFVENAIKHAQLNKVENPYIKVLIGIENNLLSISVKDNGAGMRKDPGSLDMLSHSMTVIKARIQLLFQQKNKTVNENLFTVKTVPELATGTMVKFYLPLNQAL